MNQLALPLGRQWEKIPGWPYEACKDGRIRRIGSNHSLKPMPFNTGYLGVDLSDAPRRKRCLVHRLIAIAFLGNPPDDRKYAAAHYDGDKTNNCLANLRWANYSENCMDKHRHGTAAVGNKNGARLYPERLIRGETHPRTNLTEQQVRQIRNDRRSNKEIAADYGVYRGAIWNIKNGKNWKHIL